MEEHEKQGALGELMPTRPLPNDCPLTRPPDVCKLRQYWTAREYLRAFDPNVYSLFVDPEEETLR